MMNKRGRFLILYNSVPFFLDYLNSSCVSASWVLKEIPLPLKIVRRVTRWLNLSQTIWYGTWKKNLKQFDTVIIFAPCTELELISYIKKKNANVRIIYWYWNPVFGIGIPDNNTINNVELWSFDSNDCIKYGMSFNTTFYFKEIKIPENRIEYDSIFVGKDKGREAELKSIVEILNSQELKTFLYLIPDRPNSKKKKIPYNQYLEILSKTKTIIDITALGQSGLTLRPMESIFFEKKIITTDITISAQDFYNPQNIFILGKDSTDNLKRFIATPYKPIAKDIVDRYDFNSWLERFNSK
ncbi:MAG: hypothetical protein LAT68_17225 [Cyclobacteriaceae bacterium]|nr:hypothetical protein [Cyclobacteriaceae bacterium]